MSDANWNWSDSGDGRSDGGLHNQGWQQPSTYANPTQQRQLRANTRAPTSTDYYAQHASSYGVPNDNYGYASNPNDFFTQPQQQQYPSSFPEFPSQQGVFGASTVGDFSQQVMSDPMLSAAKHIGGQFAEQQREKLAKYLSAFQLKYYFAVDNAYVGKKLGILLFPFIHKDWAVRYDSSDTPTPPRFDVNAPDLYIPLMAFVTYILISGFVLGTQGRFTPEQLGIITTNAMAYLLFENLIILVTKYVMNISHALTVWHSLAYSSYKYVGMNIGLLAFLVGGKMFYYGALAYTSLAIVVFLLRTVKNFVLDVQGMYNSYDEGKKRKLYLLLFISFTQPFLMWWLTSGVTGFVPGKLDFAQLALSGMGLSEAANKGQIPLLPDGEVDYETLLKMP